MAADDLACASAPGVIEPGEAPELVLARLALFRDLSPAERAAIVAAGEVIGVEQDRVIPRAGAAGEPAFVYVVLKGQVAFGEFERGQVPKPPDKKKRAVPIMTVARRNLALFEVGDFFANDASDALLDEGGAKTEGALFTALPVVLFRLPRVRLDELLAHAPTLAHAIEAHAEAAYYRQSFLKLDRRREIFDFYVRHGLEYAQSIKIIQADRCIDCDECVRACEDRHGVARIERFGPTLGLIQLTDNCRTCYDARCIPECNFDAIGFDAKLGEVVVYDNCVGCTKCAKACPHEAIQMVDVVLPEPDLVARVKAAQGDRPKTVVAPGEENAPKKKPKRIANKCDHCLGHADLACISACPTGAILQIDPRALFRRDAGDPAAVARYFDPAPFELGYSEVARRQGVGILRGLFWVVGVGVLLALVEFAWRRGGVDLSPSRALTELFAGAPAASQIPRRFSAATGFGRWLGYVGAILMVVSALYTIRLHVPGIRRLGGSRTWFDLHVVFGLAGPALALLHTNLAVFQPYWVVLVFWAIVLVVLSGVVGRFVYTALPRVEAAANRTRGELDQRIRRTAREWSSRTVSANVLEQYLKAAERSPPRGLDALGPLALLRELVIGELARVRSLFRIERRLLRDMKNRELRRAALALLAEKESLERRGRWIGGARRLLAAWRAIHIVLTLAMFFLLAIHVAVSVWALGW